MQIGIGLSLTGGSSYSASPADLFAAGEQGFWYDPSDFSTMFQDSAGTTPVTGTGQPVGKINDKSGRGNHIIQATTASRPTLQQDGSGYYYLAFDSVDDWLSTSTTVDFTATSNAFLCAAVTKGSDVATGVIVELSVDTGANNGSFVMYAPNGPGAQNFGFGLKGTTFAGYNPTGFVSPQTKVLSLVMNLGATGVANELKPYVNGVLSQTGASGTDVGTGNFGNYTLYVGRKGGVGNTLNGRIYQLIGRGEATGDALRQAIERYCGSKNGVTV